MIFGKRLHNNHRPHSHLVFTNHGYSVVVVVVVILF